MEKIVDYSISYITVYQDRARLTCQGNVQVDTKTKRLVLDELPLTLELDSVRVAGKGTSKVRILGVEIARHHYEQTPVRRVRDLEDQIERLEDEMQVLADDHMIWEAQAEHLQGLRQATREYARGMSRGHTSVEDQALLMQFFGEQDDKIHTAMRDVDLKKRDLNRRLNKLRSELDDLCAARPRQRYQARIEIEVSNDGNFQLELTYVVRSVGWQPLYDLRLLEEEDDQTLELSIIAQVTQRTGQDWNGVQVSMSTARPALNQRLPELKPWFLDEYQPPQPRIKGSRSAELEPTMAVMSTPLPIAGIHEALADDYQEAEVPMAEVHQSGTAVTFVVPGQWDILSDGSPHKIMVNRFRLDPKIDYLAIPRHTDAVYRRVTIINKGGGPMLEGEASSFMGEEFIGKTRIKYTPVDGELELLLGVEERLVIKSDLKKRAVDKLFCARIDCYAMHSR